ncbi:MAG: hypothetical protein JOS17DRAFT_92302 [Linnemannia elongata]|nr:MAG: hypothetical protein JOS17DRAFT_92302 [Linnemannia elongata]
MFAFSLKTKGTKSNSPSFLFFSFLFILFSSPFPGHSRSTRRGFPFDPGKGSLEFASSQAYAFFVITLGTPSLPCMLKAQKHQPNNNQQFQRHR